MSHDFVPPSPAGIADRRTYLSAFCEAAKILWPGNRRLTVVCHGHSVPAGYFLTPDVRPLDSYPHLLRVALAERFPNSVINVIVTAVGGENSIVGAARFDEDVLTLKPDVVTIDYSLNDRGYGPPRPRAAWVSMIERCQQKGIPVILLTPTPDTAANLADENDPLNVQAAQVRSLATEYHVGLVDSLAAFYKQIAAGVELESLMSQRNHPNRKGHELVAAELIPWFPA